MDTNQSQNIEILYMYYYHDLKTDQTIMKIGTTTDLIKRVREAYADIRRMHSVKGFKRPINAFIDDNWYVCIVERNHLHLTDNRAAETALTRYISQLLKPLDENPKTTIHERYIIDQPAFSIHEAKKLMVAALYSDFNLDRPIPFQVRRTLDFKPRNGHPDHDLNVTPYINEIARQNQQLLERINTLNRHPHRIGRETISPLFVDYVESNATL